MKCISSIATFCRTMFMMVLFSFLLCLGLSIQNHTLSPIVRPLLQKATCLAPKNVIQRQKFIDTAYRELVTGQSIPVTRAFFMPTHRDLFKNVMLGLIYAEKKRIDIAAYTFNYKPFADALMHAADRGVKIRIVADGNNSKSQYSKVSHLNHPNITRYLYYSNNKGKWDALMHHKFMIFHLNVQNRKFLEWGSFNYSQSALANRENATITSSPKLINQFCEQFEDLIKCCRPYHS